jgi:DNA-binding response OmpR family regulator
MLKNAKEDHHKHRIMFVDDEIDILDVVARGLESFGFEVYAFSNPLKALSLFRLRYYDAIILDIRMPEMSGFELARKIWQLDSNSTICFFSAFEGYENEALKIFFNKHYCFVKKPSSIGKLARHITSHLSSEATLPH